MQYALLKRQSDWQTKWSERNAGHWYRSCFSVFGGKVLSQQWSQKWSWREKTNTSYQTGTTSFADAGGKRRWLRNAACIVTGNFFWICLRIWVMIFDAQKGWHWVQRINIQERLLDVGETSLWSDFSAETWRRVHFHLLMRTSETSRIFPWSFDWTFKHWQLNRPSIWFEHPSQESRGALVVGYWSDFADDWFVKDVLSHHTTETVRDIILNIAGIAWYYVDRGSAQTASPQTGDCVHHSPTRRAKDDLQRWSFSTTSWAESDISETHYAFNVSNQSQIKCRLQSMMMMMSTLRDFCFARPSWSHTSKCDDADHSRLLCSVESTGQNCLQIYTDIW